MFSGCKLRKMELSARILDVQWMRGGALRSLDAPSPGRKIHCSVRLFLCVPEFSSKGREKPENPGVDLSLRGPGAHLGAQGAVSGVASVPRLVLKTNTLVFALLFRQDRLSWFHHPWQSRRVVELVCSR